MTEYEVNEFSKVDGMSYRPPAMSPNYVEMYCRMGR
jgi:hypothetical protein